MEYIIGTIIGIVVMSAFISVAFANHDNDIYMEGFLAGKKELPNDTNGNKIRSMSDEELADTLLELGIDNCEKIPFCTNSDKCNDIMDAGELIPDELCRECLINWLQS